MNQIYEKMNLTTGINEDNEVVRLRKVTTAERAVINEVNRAGHNGFVTITYHVRDRHHTNHRYTVTLVTSQRTRIKDQFGKPISVRHLKEGMVVDAQFSSEMTRSQPPQSNAYAITVRRQSQESLIDECIILDVSLGRDSQSILTGIPGNPQSQMRYLISKSTLLRNQWGEPVPLSTFHAGQQVKIERALAETRSIPPQTQALTVQRI